MLLNRKTFELESVAGISQSMDCVRIEEDGSAVATDGHMLFKFSPLEELNPKEYPKLDGINPNGKGGKLRPFSLPTSAARAVLRTVPKGRKLSLPILRSIALDVEQTNAGSCAVLGFTDLKRPTIIRPEKITDDFPDYHKLVPNGKAKVAIGLNVPLLRRAMRLLQALDVEYIALKIREPNMPVVIEAQTETKDGKVFGLIMPAKVEDDEVKANLAAGEKAADKAATAPEAEKKPNKKPKSKKKKFKK
jgi:hypothetical protein